MEALMIKGTAGMVNTQHAVISTYAPVCEKHRRNSNIRLRDLEEAHDKPKDPANAARPAAACLSL